VQQPTKTERSAVAGSTVILRADLGNGVSAELAQTVSTLARAGARVAVIAGFGRPGGDVNPALSLRSFAMPLAKLADVPVTFISDCVGTVAESALARVAFGEAALMENLRFHTDEKRDSRSFALRLSVLGDFFAVTGKLPSPPARWIGELASILPSPGIARATPTKEMS
jgi:phosphoglycerate kinase